MNHSTQNQQNQQKQTTQRTENNLLQALKRAQETKSSAGADSRPSYRIAGLRISMAAPTSANPNYLYIKDSDYEYLGKISPSGEVLLARGVQLDPVKRTCLLSAIHAPEYAAKQEGLLTGTCSCCGRTLTNPVSVKLGIGPVCRGDWFPASANQPDILADLGLEEPGTTATAASKLTGMQIVKEAQAEQAELAQKEAAKEAAKEANAEADRELQDIIDAYHRLPINHKLSLINKIFVHEVMK